MNNLRSDFEKEKNLLVNQFSDSINLLNELNIDFKGLINVEEQINQLKKAQTNLENQNFEIVVVGEFSTGKSTFINALMKKNVLPSKVTSTTATINFLKHAEQNNGVEESLVYMKNGETLRITHEEVFEYTTEMSKSMNVSEEVKHIDIFIKSDYLKNGIVIVDTPGLAALNEEHIKITYNKIKTSQASIMLFNSEQAGRDTEFKFLQRLKDSIGRIFFVVNRIDVTPPNELPDVLNNLKENLLNNKYINIPEEHAKLFPVSAMQALKVNVPSLDVGHTWWKNLSEMELREESRFFEFEDRLEDYLFNGEQSEDKLNSPRYTLEKVYDLLINRINTLENEIENDDIQELKDEYENLKQLVDLKRKELSKIITKFSNEINEIKENTIIKTKEDIEESSKEFYEKLDEAESTYELQETLNEDIDFYTNDVTKIFSNQISKMLKQVDENIKQHYEDMDFKFRETNIDNNINIDQINIQIKEKEQSLSKFSTFDKEEYDRQKQELKDAREQLKFIRQREQEYLDAQNDIETIESEYIRENKYFDDLFRNIDPTKKERKERLLFKFMREHEYEAENPEYRKVLEEQRNRYLAQSEIKDEYSAKVRKARRELNLAKSDMEYDYENLGEIKEREKELHEQMRQDKLNAINLAKEEDLRQLKKEKRKIKQVVKKQSREYINNFIESIDNLDSLEMAKNKIERHIQEEDEELKKSNAELAEKEKFLNESREEKERVKALIKEYQDKLVNKKIEMA